MIDVSEPLIYEFEGFRLDGRSRVLTRADTSEMVPLTPKVADVLFMLIQNRGQLVTKDELLDNVWKGAFVEESNLAQTVFVLRKTLGDERKEPHFIRTVPHRGYQFIAAVREIRQGDEILDESILSDADSTVGQTAPPSAARKRMSGPALIAAGLLTVIVGLGFYWFWIRPTSTVTPEIKTIAILPFEDLSEQQAERYLGISLADALAQQFGKVKQVTVRPIGSVLKYSSERRDYAAIGRELQADAILEGRIQRMGDRLRVNAQLIRVSDNATVWVESFDDAFTNFFAVQDSISGKVATSLSLRMDDGERRRFEQRGTTNPEAYQAYMRGRYFWNKRTGDNLMKAIGEFEQAVQKDPRYAIAFSGLADCHQLTAEYARAAPKEAFTKAREAAQTALEIDPELAEAHTSLGYTQAFYDWDWPAADRSFRRALEIDPNYTTAHQWYGEYLTAVGRFDEARMHYERALQIDPTSPILMTEVASVLHVQRRYDEMMDQARRIIEMDPNFAYAYFYLGLGYEAKGMHAEMVDAQATMFTLFGEPAEIANEVRTAFSKDGVRGFWKKRLDQTETKPHLKYFPEFTKAIIRVRAGDNEGALASLNRSLERREHNVVYAKYVPDLDPMRDDPRFQEIIRQLGL